MTPGTVVDEPTFAPVLALATTDEAKMLAIAPTTAGETLIASAVMIETAGIVATHETVVSPTTALAVTVGVAIEL
jgi:hypothetical protein